MKDTKNSTLLFIYNADNGLQNKILDAAHKIISPKTYQCELCALTHGTFGAKREWSDFLEVYDRKMKFLYRDEFKKQYASKFISKYEFPLVLLESEYELELIISKNELQAIDSIEELIGLVKERDVSGMRT